MIDLITGHQGFEHVTAEQVANVNNALTAGYGDNAVLRLKDGAVTSTGLSIGVGVGYWRANGFDAEITSAETIYVDPSSVGTSRIDKFYIEILQDIPSGNQRAELVYVKGTEASVPTPPADPTAPALTTDIMLQCVCYASAVIQENSLTLTDLTKTIQNVTPEDMTLVKSWIRDNANVYSPSMPYYRGEVVITPLDGKIYECNEFCSANTWENNQSHFTERTIIDILSKIGKQTTEIHKYGTCVTAAATTEKKINTEYGDFKLEIGRGVYAKFSYANTASSPTLKVDSATAKTIKGYGSSDPSTWWKAGDIVHFVYDGTNFVMLPTQGQITDLNQALNTQTNKLLEKGTYELLKQTTSTSGELVSIDDKYSKIAICLSYQGSLFGVSEFDTRFLKAHNSSLVSGYVSAGVNYYVKATWNSSANKVGLATSNANWTATLFGVI